MRTIELVKTSAVVYDFPEAIENFMKSTNVVQIKKIKQYAKNEELSLYEIIFKYIGDSELQVHYGYYNTNQLDKISL